MTVTVVVVSVLLLLALPAYGHQAVRVRLRPGRPPTEPKEPT